MHRSGDRLDRLGQVDHDVDPPRPQTRREHRLARAQAQASQHPSVPSDAVASDRQTTLKEFEFSVGALFSPKTNERPDLQADSQANIITVCTGNICRSPLAALVLATRLADLDLIVHSAGTRAMVGSGMPSPARILAEQNGVSRARAASHRGRLLTETLIGDADLVLTMTAQHSESALALTPRRLHQTFTVREFARLAGSLSEDQLRTAARGAENARSRLGAVVQMVADQRATAPRAKTEEDVVDPYRQPVAVYELSAAQMMPALAQVERVVRVALA